MLGRSGGGAAAGDHARGGLEVKAFRGGPLLEGSNAGGAGKVGRGPGGGVEVEVANKDGGDIWGKGETQEGLEGGRVVDVVVEGDDAEGRWAVMNVGDEETRMTAEVRPDHTAPRDKLPLTSTRV